jgi:hypothetical protein
MHVLILSKRNGEAQTRLLESAAALAEYFELDPALVEGLKQTSKDTAVRALKEREAVAGLLEALGIKVGAIREAAPAEETVTAVTEPDPNQDLATPGVPFAEGAALDELPPPVLDEVPSEETAVTAVTETDEPKPEELPAGEPTEEEPQAKPSRNKRGRSKKG